MDKNVGHLLVVRFESFLQCFDRVILPLHEGLPSNVVLARDLWRVELIVVASSTGSMYPTAYNPLSEHVLVDFELEDCIDLLTEIFEHAVQLLSLVKSTGEPIQQETTLGRVFVVLNCLNLILDELDDMLILNKLTGFHDLI